MNTELKNMQHSFHTIVLVKGDIFANKCWFFAKKHADISKIKGVVVLKKGIFSENTCVYSCEIFKNQSQNSVKIHMPYFEISASLSN